MQYVTDARTLAHYVVHKCTRDSKPVSNLQLQKILYFLQSVYCRATKGSLLFPEEFQAWPYGPVICSVYEEYSSYGGSYIEKTYDSLLLGVPADIAKFIDEGIENLREHAPWSLVRMSHAKNSPWDLVYRDGAGYKRQIPNESIINAALANAN